MSYLQECVLPARKTMQMIVIAVLGAILIFVISPHASAEGKSLLSVKLIILLLLFVLRTTVVE